MSKNPLYTKENELFACLIRHYLDQFTGWENDYIGEQIESLQSTRDYQFLENNPLIAGFALSLGGVSFDDEPVFVQKLARLLASSTCMYKAAYDSELKVHWNPPLLSYKQFTDEHANVEPYLANCIDAQGSELEMLQFLRHCRQFC